MAHHIGRENVQCWRLYSSVGGTFLSYHQMSGERWWIRTHHFGLSSVINKSAINVAHTFKGVDLRAEEPQPPFKSWIERGEKTLDLGNRTLHDGRALCQGCVSDKADKAPLADIANRKTVFFALTVMKRPVGPSSGRRGELELCLVRGVATRRLTSQKSWEDRCRKLLGVAWRGPGPGREKDAGCLWSK